MILPKLLVLGHGRHGKDTACEMIKELGYTYRPTSKLLSDLFIFDYLKETHGYKNSEDCYNDRHNHRSIWYKLIQDYCRDDLTRLGKQVFAQYNVYCGLRDFKQLDAMRKSQVFDYAIWVDRSSVVPQEPSTSMTIHQSMCDFMIDNNADTEHLKKNIVSILEEIETRQCCHHR